MSKGKFVGRRRTKDAAPHIEAGTPILKWVLALTTLFSIVLLIGGVYLFVNGASGNTEIELLGNHFKSTNVGIAAFFIGAVVFLATVRRTLKSLERLGALAPDKITKVEYAPAPIAPGIHPDFGIRELFYHIRPDLLDGVETELWKSVGADVMDNFSTGRVAVWGRPMYASRRRGPLKRVDEPGYWAHAEFSYWFLKEDGREQSHTWVKSESGLPDYCDLRVNRAQVLSVWPTANTPETTGPFISLLEAAKRAYSATRGMPAGQHAEMFDNDEDEILKWYCVWFAQHIPIFGARRPSDRMEPVSIDKPPKDFFIVSGSLILRERIGGAVVWENLRAKYPDVLASIEQLKSYQ